jgi:hypothetical protein
LTTPVESARDLGMLLSSTASLWETTTSPQNLSTVNSQYPSRNALSSPSFTLLTTTTRFFFK